MKFYLMRHGQAANPDVDPQQGLTTEGREAIKQLAERLVSQGVAFQQVFHSEKVRAQQTAEIMAATLAPDITPKERSGLKPNDDPAKWLAELEVTTENTLITSHLPFVPRLLSMLTGSIDIEKGMGFMPGTIICLQKKEDAWKIEWVESP